MHGATLNIHTDGGSRGNPGPAAGAFVIDSDGKEIFKSSKYFGVATNNVAEYKALLLATDWINGMLEEIEPSALNFFLDSELIVKQINGLYKIKDENLKAIYIQIMSNLKSAGVPFNFKHIPREQNKLADMLVNQELDSSSR